MRDNTGTRRWEKDAKRLIPGGSQLLSKRAELFVPEQWPSYYERADGVTVTDLDGNEYVDMSIMGIGACVLGYGNDRVNNAVRDVVDAGPMATLNAPEELDLAEELVEMHPWADMVRYARTGGEAMTIAVRLARAATGDDTVAFCGYHGWHDWYLAANLAEPENLEGHLLPGLEPKGVPDALEGTAQPFEYNDAAALETIVENNDVGAIVMEPVRNVEPDPEFMPRVRELADKADAPLVFDEITSGLRVRVGGAHERFNVTPDVVVYGKALGNGYPMAAVLGRKHIMDMAQESFVSSTFWTERIGPVAALETLSVMRDEDVPSHLVDLGETLQRGLTGVANDNGLELHVDGLPPLTHFSFDHEDGQALKTLFTQEMLDEGYLASNSVYLSAAHTPDHVDAYLESVDRTFETLADAISRDAVVDELDGPVAHSKFERLN